MFLSMELENTGVNMPARTVAFDTLKKFDGRSFRQMKTLEFYQLAGRAGRRGIDPMGWVVTPFLPRDIELPDMETLIYGDVEPLISQFDLSFNSVLNLYSGHKSEEIRTILKRNFAQFQANKELPKLTQKVSRLRTDIENAQPRCTKKKDDFGAFIEFYQRKQSILNSMRSQTNATLGGLHGRRNRFAQERVEQEFSEKIASIEKEEESFTCGSCSFKKRCIGRFFQVGNLQKKLDYWRSILEQQEELLLPSFEKKIAIMRKMGYLDDSGLLARGEFASKIHTEEISVTELYFKGFFHEWNCHEINALALSIVYEFRKKDVRIAKIKRKEVEMKLKDAKAFISHLARQCNFIKPLDISLSLVMHSWSMGESFDQILNLTNLPEGDLIRAFRHAIDLLRQIREATEDRSLRDKITASIDIVNRDIILATELRD
ncbi:hypothetical protein HYY75_07395 [bacterium]|nr:hypothetical protein [bacterium]